MARPEPDDRYFGLPELAAYSSLSERTLRKYLKAAINRLPAHRVGGVWLIRKSEFDHWVEAHDQVVTRATDPRGALLRARVAAAVRGMRASREKD